MIPSLIGALVMGTIIGFGGRAVLPGAQHIGLGKTIGLGVVANLIVSALTTGAGFFFSVIIGSAVAAALLWIAVRQGWLGSDSGKSAVA